MSVRRRLAQRVPVLFGKRRLLSRPVGAVISDGDLLAAWRHLSDETVLMSLTPRRGQHESHGDFMRQHAIRKRLAVLRGLIEDDA